MSQKNLVCPNCNKDINIEQLFNANQEYYNDFINNKIKKILEEKESLIKEEAKKDSLQNIELVRQTIIAEKNQEMMKVKSDLDKQINLVSQLKQDQAKEIELISEKTKNNFQHEINELEKKLQILNAEIANKESYFKNNIDLEKAKLEKNFLLEKETLVKQYSLEIQELKEANLQYKIINSKTKGENFEKEVEVELNKAFSIYDKISKITVGDKKADYLQEVRNHKGEQIGKIVYEVKNAKWSNSWVGKLVADAANNKTKYGILIATSFKDHSNGIPFQKSDEYENIWISDAESFVFLAQVVRRLIILEYNYNLEKSKLMNNNNSDLTKEYESQIQKVRDFISQDLQMYIKDFNKRLEDILKTSRSLSTNSTNLVKIHDAMKKDFEKKLLGKLSDILSNKLS